MMIQKDPGIIKQCPKNLRKYDVVKAFIDVCHITNTYDGDSILSASLIAIDYKDLFSQLSAMYKKISFDCFINSFEEMAMTH